MDRKFIISTAVVFGLSMVLGFIIHGILLKEGYALLPDLFRAEDSGHMSIMLLAHVFYAFPFVWIYRKGKEASKPWLEQGLKFGIALALYYNVSTYLIYYAVQPMPADLVMKQIIFDSIGTILMGTVVAWFEK